MDCFELLLILSWRKPLLHRNQFIDLLCKSMDWFLYDNGPRHERVNVFYYKLQEVSVPISLRVVTNCLFRGKNYHFPCCYCKVKTEKCDQSNLRFSEDFRTFIPCSTTYFLEVSARISLNIECFLEIKNLQNSIFEAIILT